MSSDTSTAKTAAQSSNLGSFFGVSFAFPKMKPMLIDPSQSTALRYATAPMAPMTHPRKHRFLCDLLLKESWVSKDEECEGVASLLMNLSMIPTHCVSLVAVVRPSMFLQRIALGVETFPV